MAKPLGTVASKERLAALPAVLADLSRLIHEPARLAILTVLASCGSADFTFLEAATGLTKGNLSVQLTRLEEGSLIAIEKAVKKNRVITTAQITSEGRQQFQRYWWQMQEIRDAMERRADPPR